VAAPQDGVHGDRGIPAGRRGTVERHLARRAAGRNVTPNFRSVLGAQPLLGRGFTDDEDARGARVVDISYGLWQRRFGASPDVLGRSITLNDSPYEVIGAMPREFSFMPARDIDIWMPTTAL
jgi:putative ABC transport system permease protein